MRGIRSILLLLLGLIAVVCSLTAWFVHQERRQESLNRDLIASVKHNDTKSVIALLDLGADANCHDEPYRPVPWWQILRDRLTGKHPKPSKAPTPLLRALHWTPQPHTFRNTEVFPDNLPLVKALLDHKADVNFRDEFGYPPLLYAIEYQMKATIHLLLKYRADMRSDSGLDPLVVAASCFPDSTDVIADMLQRGADVNQRSIGQFGPSPTALLVAVNTLNVEGVRLLLSYHADVTLRRWDEYTPLALAQRNLAAAHKEESAKAHQILHLLQQAGAKE